ncbi:hypothetical protein U1Q18_007143 [Sarracenia purpurea var. burkii]
MWTDDSLRVLLTSLLSDVEATLVKLRQGSSQCDLVSSSGQAMKIDTDTNSSSHVEAITTDTILSTSCTLSSSSDFLPTGTSKEQQPNKTMSIIYLFSRYKSSQSAISSSDEVVMTKENCSFDSSCAGTVDR